MLGEERQDHFIEPLTDLVDVVAFADEPAPADDMAPAEDMAAADIVNGETPETPEAADEA